MIWAVYALGFIKPLIFSTFGSDRMLLGKWNISALIEL